MARAMGAEKGSEPPVARMLRFFIASTTWWIGTRHFSTAS